MPILIPILIPLICRKVTLGLIPMVIPMQSYCENYLKNHLIGTNICVKLGTVPICIGKGIRIGISIGPLYTLKETITPNSIGIGIGIGVGQCKHTINLLSFSLLLGVNGPQTDRR